MSIDVGPDAINRVSSTAGGWTVICLDNPANANGILDTVEIWSASNLSGAKVGTFYNVSGSTYRCRDSAAIGSVTAGSKQTFDSLSIDVRTGDYIGIFWSSGSMERSLLGYSGYYYASGDNADPDDSASYTYSSGKTLSVYATGTESSSSSSSSSESSSSSSISSVSSSSSSSISSSSSSSSVSSSSWSYSSSSLSSAAALTFPDLAKGFEFAIVEDIDDSGEPASEPPMGRQLVAITYYKAIHQLRIAIRYMTSADRKTLARFYLTDTAGGVKPFELVHPKTGQQWLVRFDPDRPPIWSLEERLWEKHRCEFWLLEDIDDGYLLGIYPS